jgi:chloride channel 2
LKAVLSGLNIFRFFSFVTFFGKGIGITAALVAGLSVGREGPYVHMSAIIANKLMKSRYFNHFEKNQSLQKQMYASAIAAGVTATFGAPIGGVLFSIEVASTYYMISNLWKAFFASVSCIIVYKFLSYFTVVEFFS